MTKLSKLLTGIALVGSLVGCGPLKDNSDYYSTTINGNNVEVIQSLKDSTRRIMIHAPKHFDLGDHYLVARDLDWDYNFEDIFLDGFKVEQKSGLLNHPLSQYADQDSLNRMYNTVLNESKPHGHK